MTKDEANKFFQPASENKRLAGQYIVWKVEQNYTGQKEERYCLGLVSKKSGDVLITSKFDRVRLFSAYVVSVDIAAKWPTWDETLGNKKITKSEMMEILESL